MSQYNFRRPFRAYNPTSAFNRVGTSISRWCSSDCECPLPTPFDGMEPCMEPSFLFLTQDTGFTLEAGQAFPFSGRAVVSGDSFLCEEEIMAYWAMNERREERRRPPRRPSRCSSGSGCNSVCPEFTLCCMPIIDEETSSELCMCGVCESDIDRSECYHFENGYVFLEPGVYLIEYNIVLPGDPTENNPINTEVHLVANGMIVPGSSRTIEHYGVLTETVQVRVLFEACEPTTLSLVSTNAITLMPTTEGELLVTMTINGLC